MRYLGGKAKIAKPLAAAIRANTSATRLWEPFCGGLNATRALVDAGFRVYASDANAALISLYSAWRAGWRPPPPELVTKEGHAAAKTLPDSDPLKAFYGVGLSFGGDYFCGFTGAVVVTGARRDDYYGAACRALAKDTAAPTAVACVSFLAAQPAPAPFAIYCDPPYVGTTGYKATGAFDHAAFWARCRWWAACGVDVFVSEYTAPPDVVEIARFAKRKTVSASGNTDVATDRLFLVR